MKTSYSEEELLQKRISDAITQSEKRPQFIGFLNETDAAAAKAYLKRKNVQYLFWGGYAQAERTMLGIFPDYFQLREDEFPVAALTFLYRQEDSLSHRDFLGSLMGLGIDRAVVGDILPGPGKCTVFFRQEMQDYVQRQVEKIGKIGVRIAPGCKDIPIILREYEECCGVIASDRLDCITAFLCRTSREKAVQAISSGLVQQNHRDALSPSGKIHQGDVISIRKKGKYIVDQLGPLTSKGRLSLKCRKYK